MKTITTALAILSSSLLIACGSADDEMATRPENNPSLLVSSNIPMNLLKPLPVR